MTAYGFLSSDQQLPDDCRNDTTLQYFLRNSDFIRVIENRTEGTIRYSDGNGIRMCRASKEKSLSKARAFGVTTDEGRHLEVLERFLSQLEPGSIIMFSSVERFSKGRGAALYLYRKMIDAGVILRFLDEPWLDSDLYSSVYQEYPRIDSVVHHVIQVTYDKIGSYNSILEMISSTETNAAKKNEAGR